MDTASSFLAKQKKKPSTKSMKRCLDDSAKSKTCGVCQNRTVNESLSRGTRDDTEEQSCSDLRSRRRNRRCCRTRLCARGGQAFSHRAPLGTGRSGRQGSRFRRRIRRGGGGRRSRRAGCGQAYTVRGRQGGP